MERRPPSGCAGVADARAGGKRDRLLPERPLAHVIHGASRDESRAATAAWRASDAPTALAEPAAIVARASTPPKALSRVRKWARRADESAPYVLTFRVDCLQFRAVARTIAKRLVYEESTIVEASPLPAARAAFTSRVAWTRRTHLGSRTRGLTFGRRRTPPSVFRSATPLARADPGGDRLVRNFGKRAAGGEAR